MSLMPGQGYYMRMSGYGTIEKCPHCTATNIDKSHKNQVTCGKLSCREKQKHLMTRKRRERAQRRGN